MIVNSKFILTFTKATKINKRNKNVSKFPTKITRERKVKETEKKRERKKSEYFAHCRYYLIHQL